MTSSSQRSDARANRAALLEAAIELFASHGPTVAYEEIAVAAGVGRATLYRHFPTREDLLAAILAGILDRLETLAADLPRGPTRLATLFDACVEEQERHLPMLELATRATPPDELRRSRGRFESLLDEPLRDAQAAGVARENMTAADVRLIILMLSGLLQPTFSDLDRRRAIELARSLIVDV